MRTLTRIVATLHNCRVLLAGGVVERQLVLAEMVDGSSKGALSALREDFGLPLGRTRRRRPDGVRTAASACRRSDLTSSRLKPCLAEERGPIPVSGRRRPAGASYPLLRAKAMVSNASNPTIRTVAGPVLQVLFPSRRWALLVIAVEGVRCLHTCRLVFTSSSPCSSTWPSLSCRRGSPGA